MTLERAHRWLGNLLMVMWFVIYPLSLWRLDLYVAQGIWGATICLAYLREMWSSELQRRTHAKLLAQAEQRAGAAEMRLTMLAMGLTVSAHDCGEGG